MFTDMVLTLELVEVCMYMRESIIMLFSSTCLVPGMAFALGVQ